MTGFNPAVVDLAGSNLVLVVIVAVIALGALALAAMFRKEVLDADEGTDNMKNIALAVQEGANAYLTRQFRTLGIFAAVAFVALLALPADDIGGAHRPFGRLPVRRRLLRSRRLLRHVAGGQGQPAGRRSRQRRGSRPGHEDRVPHRRHGRHAHRRPGPARRQPGGAHLPGRGAARARGLRLRCCPARHVHASRWRHLHEGCRRRCRPRRQGRAEHPRGRPAQRGHHRRQRGRQRGRLRRHGRRPVRVVRRDAGRCADPRIPGLRQRRPRLPAADPRDRCADGGAGCLHHHPAAGRERPDHDQPRLLHLRGRERRGLCDRLLHLPARAASPTSRT